MVLSRALLAGAALAAMALTGTAQAAVTIADNSFESPVVTNSNLYIVDPTGIPGVTFNALSGIARNGSVFLFFPSYPAPDGSQAAFIQSNSSGTGAVSLQVSGLVSGQSYTISFDASAINSTNGPSFYPADPLTVSFNGTQLGGLYTPAVGTTANTFMSFTTPSFVAGGSTGLIAFTGSQSTPLEVSLLDLVTVNAVAVAGGVPEPATWAMMLVGFAGLGGTLRLARRKKATALAAA